MTALQKVFISLDLLHILDNRDGMQNNILLNILGNDPRSQMMWWQVALCRALCGAAGIENPLPTNDGSYKVIIADGGAEVEGCR